MEVKKQQWKILKKNFRLALDLINGQGKGMKPSKTFLWASWGKSEKSLKENFNLAHH